MRTICIYTHIYIYISLNIYIFKCVQMCIYIFFCSTDKLCQPTGALLPFCWLVKFFFGTNKCHQSQEVVDPETGISSRSLGLDAPACSWETRAGYTPNTIPHPQEKPKVNQ